MAKQGKYRQRRGTGTLRFKNGKWEGTYKVYRENGTYIEKSFTRRTQEEIDDIKAELRLLGIIENRVQDIDIDRNTNKITLIYNKETKTAISKDMTISDYMNIFLFEHRRYGMKGKVIEDGTFATYVDRCNIIERNIGNKRIRDLTLQDLKKFIKDIQEEGLAESTVKQTRDLLASLMKYAKKDGITTENILADERLTIQESKEKKEKKIVVKNDYEKYITYCKEHNYFDLIFLLFTGVREGELAGILWKDIDLEKGIVDINKEYGRIVKVELVNGKRKKTITKGFKELKSKKSYRKIGIECLVDKLKKHKEQQKELAKSKGKEFTENDFVFTNKNYEGQMSDCVWDKVKAVMNELKIKDYKSLSTHNLRHSFCTNGLKDGVKIEEMQKLMGHSSIATTLIYTHIDEEQILEASKQATQEGAKYL